MREREREGGSERKRERESANERKRDVRVRMSQTMCLLSHKQIRCLRHVTVDDGSFTCEIIHTRMLSLVLLFSLALSFSLPHTHTHTNTQRSSLLSSYDIQLTSNANGHDSITDPDEVCMRE